MDNDIQKLETFFEKQLERSNYWLSFAEAKNAALLALNVAVIAFIAEFQKDFPVISTLIMVVFIASSLVCLWSFYPNKDSRPKDDKKSSSSDNFIFWNDIAHIENEGKYIECVIARYFPGITLKNTENKLCIDLSCEIVISSRIAAAKYKLFSLALKIDFLAFALSVLLLVAA